MTITQARAGMRMTVLDRRVMLKLLGVGAGAAACSGGAMARTMTAAQSDTPQGLRGTTLRQQIAAYVAAARFEDLPAAVVEKAKEQIVFFFGRAFASASSARARHALEFARQIGRFTDRVGGDAGIIGDRLRLAPADAALVNASLFSESLPLRALLNDAIHPGVITLPAALAIGEIRRVSGRELLLALVLGYEVLGKLRQTMSSTCRATSIVAGYAATAAAGRLFGLDREHMFDALSYASGPCIHADRDATAELYPGVIARNGMFAAHLAHADAHGIPHELDEAPAHRSPFADTELPDSIDELGYWEILTALHRPHRTTGHDAAAVELLADLIETHRLSERSVSTIEVVLPTSGSRARDMELAARGPFKPACLACSSVPYGLARVLADGRIDTTRFGDDELANDPLVSRLMQAVEVSFEDGRGARWARVTVHTRDGRKLERERDFFICDLPPDMWHGWLSSAGRRVFQPGQLLQLTRVIHNLETVEDVSQLLAAATVTQAGARA
jgi:2-methylcitrate dehydratase PrpD